MASIAKWLSKLARRAPLPPRQFTNTNFTTLSETCAIEEETIPGYIADHFYPVRIGEVFQDRYQVVGKLGFGSTSTVWLARDLDALRRHVALKVFVRGTELETELKMYQRLERGSTTHRGRRSVRMALDAFKISSSTGEHHCLVHAPLWDSLRTFQGRNPINRLPAMVIRGVMFRLFEALDYIHTECQIIHTDIKADNILLGIDDPSDPVFEEFEKAELESPCPRKIQNGRTIYTSRRIPKPARIGLPVLCDFGAALCGQKPRHEDVQPDIYRSPEVILQVPWSYEVDIWNTGAMVWDIFEDKHMFYGTDPECHTYRSRAHLAEMIALLGPPPKELLERGKLASKFFDQEGNFIGGIDVPAALSLSDREENLVGEDKKQFINFMSDMLQWLPEARKSARELKNDPWLAPVLEEI